YSSILNILEGRNELLEKIIRCVVDLGGVPELDPKRYFDVDLTVRKRVKSATAKMARCKPVYQHTMRQGGYIHVKEKMIENKEIEPDEEPPRGILRLKGRKETKDKIKEETLKVDHGTDAMTVVLGKEKGGYARRVGSGVTYKRYFDLPRSREASDERFMLLQSQLDNERRKRQEKELEIRIYPKRCHKQWEWLLN
nr:hypothetical protein [Tanacetum cinerariifolium]